MCLALSNSWYLRKDRGAPLLALKNEDIIGVDKYYFIPPLRAVLIALFDGTRSEEQVVEAFSYLTGFPQEYSKPFMQDFVKGHTESRSLPENTSPDKEPPVLVDIAETPQSKIQRYDPTKFVMKPEEVDLNDKRLIAPLSMLFLPTNKCAVNCRYCYAERQRNGTAGPLLSMTRFHEIVQEAADLGIASIQFSGGDPFMNPNIIDSIRIINSYGIDPGIIPTKKELENDTIQQLMEIGVEVVQASIDSVAPDIADFLLRSRDHVSKMLGTIRRLKSYDLRVRTNSVLTPYNVRGVPELIETLVPLGVERMANPVCTLNIYSLR